MMIGTFSFGNDLPYILEHKDRIALGEDRLSIVDDILKYRGKADILIITDTNRGGTFTRYAGKDAIDNGMVFIDGNGIKWLRQTDGTPRINVRWYGAHGYIAGQPDSYNDSHATFTAARDYIYNHNTSFSTLYIPQAREGVKNYYFLKTLVFDKDIKILGDGVFNTPKTLLLWPQNTTCIRLLSTNGAHISMEDLAIRQGSENKKLDSSAHGIDANTFVHLKNIDVSYVSGNGFNIRACAAKDSPIYGNADHSVLENCQTYDCMNGLWLEGCDVNVVWVNNCSFVHNKRWGIYDAGMLGNLFSNCHFSNNGKASKDSNVVAIYSGNYYAPVNGLVNINKRPDLHPAYWYKIVPQGNAYEWKPNRRYWSGGAAIVTDVNAFSKFDHTYTESFQPPVVLNGRSSYDGGDAGAGVKGIFLRVLEGKYIITGGSTQVENLGVNQAPGEYSMEVSSADYKNLRLQSATNSVLFRMGNSFDNHAGIGYLDSTMIFSVNKGRQSFSLNNQFFSPASTGITDLGTNNARWKKVFAGTVVTDHIIGNGATPVVLAGSGTGSGASISGTDLAGCITVKTGIAPSASLTVVTVTFNTAFSAIPRSIILTPANADAAVLSGTSMVYIDQAEITNKTFTLKAGTQALPAGKLYKWFYQVIQ